jgi:hypothetical protein
MSGETGSTFPAPGGEPTSLTIMRSVEVSTLAEDVSFMNVREVEDWCKESREHRAPILSAANAFGLSLGALVGFLPAWAATDVHTHGGWWGLFLMGWIVAVVGCILSALSMLAEDVPKLRKFLGRERQPTPLERLAVRMERACEKGRLRAAAAEAALQAKEDAEKDVETT